MTVIGKMLTFLVLVLSLGWFYLTANAYVARTNWQVETKLARDEATKMQAAAENLRKTVESTRDAGDDARRALVAERDRKIAEVTTLLKERDDLNSLYVAAFANAQKNQADATRLQALVDQLTLEIKNADEKLAKNLTDLTTATTAVAEARATAAAARLSEESMKRRVDSLEDQVAKMQSDLENVRLGQAGGPGVTSRPAPTGLRGSVTEFDASRNLVQINLGSDSRLQTGMVLSVSRVEPNGAGQYLGKLTLTLVDPKVAVGTFAPANLGRARTAADNPKSGDLITP